MKKLLALLSAAILAAALCGHAAAQDRNARTAGKGASKVLEEKEHSGGKARKAGKKKGARKAAKKNGKAAKKPGPTKKPAASPAAPVKTPEAPGQAPPPHPRQQSPVSTPPPGTGYGNLDPGPAPSAAPAAR